MTPKFWILKTYLEHMTTPQSLNHLVSYWGRMFSHESVSRSGKVFNVYSENPYASPSATSSQILLATPQLPIVRRDWACGILLVSIALSLNYVYLDEVIFKTQVGAWPMLIVTSGIGIVAAIATRDWMLSPLCCFCGTVSGVVLVGVTKNWSYAQIHIAVPLALGFSAPALILAFIVRAYLGNDMIHRVTFLRHSESPFRAVRPSKILSLAMVQFYGGRSQAK